MVHGILVREMGTRLVLAVSCQRLAQESQSAHSPSRFSYRGCRCRGVSLHCHCRASPVDDYVIWVWSGLVEPVSEQSIEVSDDPVTVGFGNLSTAKPVLPFIPSLVAAVNDHFTCLSRERRRCSVQGRRTGCSYGSSGEAVGRRALALAPVLKQVPWIRRCCWPLEMPRCPRLRFRSSNDSWALLSWVA